MDTIQEIMFYLRPSSIVASVFLFLTKLCFICSILSFVTGTVLEISFEINNKEIKKEIVALSYLELSMAYFMIYLIVNLL